jgi:hypothetical protein
MIRLMCLFFLVSAGPQTAPSEPVWELAGLKGTAAEIGVKVNAEVVRALRNVRTAEEDIADEQRRIDAEQQKILGGMPSYQWLKSDLADAELKLVAARKANDPATVDLAVRRNSDKAEIAKTEKAVLADERILGRRKQLRELQNQKAEAAAVLDQAVQWRDHFTDATRHKFHFKMPLHVGDVGIIGEVTPSSVGTRTFSAPYDVYDWGMLKDDSEKIELRTVRMHRVLIRVIGSSDTVAAGKPIIIDRAFEVAEMGYEGFSELVVLKRKADPLDDLFGQIDVRPESAAMPVTDRCINKFT